MGEIYGGYRSRPPLGGGWQREALTGGEKTAYYVSPSVKTEGFDTSLTEGGKDAPAGAAGRCTPRVLVPLRSTAWASPRTKGLSRVRSCNVSPSGASRHLPRRGRLCKEYTVSFDGAQPDFLVAFSPGIGYNGRCKPEVAEKTAEKSAAQLQDDRHSAAGRYTGTQKEQGGTLCHLGNSCRRCAGRPG